MGKTSKHTFRLFITPILRLGNEVEFQTWWGQQFPNCTFIEDVKSPTDGGSHALGKFTEPRDPRCTPFREGEWIPIDYHVPKPWSAMAPEERAEAESVRKQVVEKRRRFYYIATSELYKGHEEFVMKSSVSWKTMKFRVLNPNELGCDLSGGPV